MTVQKEALFYGPASEIVTPFFENGEVDVQSLKNEVDFMICNGVTGLFMNGLASEALMMSEKDRIICAKVILESANHRVPVMGNIIANSNTEGEAFAKMYKEMGVNAITITPPLIYKYTNDGLFDYFNDVANSVDLPVYIYNAPETGNKLSPQLVAKLFSENEKFYGYKDSTQNIIDQQTLLSLIASNRHFELLAGSDAQITTTMMLGGLGVISLITVVYPKLISELVKACEEKEWEKGVKLQTKVLRVREALKVGPFMAAYKYVSGLLGRPLGHMKKPLTGLSVSEEEKIAFLLKEQGLL